MEETNSAHLLVPFRPGNLLTVPVRSSFFFFLNQTLK